MGKITPQIARNVRAQHGAMCRCLAAVLVLAVLLAATRLVGEHWGLSVACASIGTVGVAWFWHNAKTMYYLQICISNDLERDQFN